jgi:peptide deformylase
MAVREIIILPDKRLWFVSEPVKSIDAGVRKLVEDMFETMYAAPGIGLAAIQVGVAKRVATLDLSKKEEAHEPQVFINPEITWASKEKSIHEEGCLSIPEYYEEVERPVLVRVKYLDLDRKTGWSLWDLFMGGTHCRHRRRSAAAAPPSRPQQVALSTALMPARPSCARVNG